MRRVVKDIKSITRTRPLICMIGSFCVGGVLWPILEKVVGLFL